MSWRIDGGLPNTIRLAPALLRDYALAMTNAILWLNFLSAVVGFISVIALAAATIGAGNFADFLRHAADREKRLAATDPAIGLPPLVLYVSIPLAIGLGVVIYLVPEARAYLFSIKSVSLLVFGLVVGGWILALAVMAIIQLLLAFGTKLSDLEAKKVAGWIGFSLLTVSFIFLVASTTMELFSIDQTNEQVERLP